MQHRCIHCNQLVQQGGRVFQMLIGRWYGAITPGFQEPNAPEWHPECYQNRSPLRPQKRPYACLECGGVIRLGERVSYLVVGYETDEWSMVAESRGYAIYNVKHFPNCHPQPEAAPLFQLNLKTTRRHG
jgi:hypothetical protein